MHSNLPTPFIADLEGNPFVDQYKEKIRKALQALVVGIALCRRFSLR